MDSTKEAALVLAEETAPALAQARFRRATDVANICKEIVLATTKEIGTRKYVEVEGWTSIAVAHGCTASIKENSVQEVFRDGKLVGVKAVAQVKRQSDGMVLAEAEGFVGDDEVDWYGSHGQTVKRWNKIKRAEVDVVIEKRADYAIRAMAQTRAISRVCRTAYSYVVVLMKAGLSTVPYEEMRDPTAGEQEEAGATEQKATGSEKKAEAPKTEERRAEPAGESPKAAPTEKKAEAPKAKAAPSVPRDESVGLEAQFADGAWKEAKVHFGSNRGIKLGDLKENSLLWYCFDWEGKGKSAALPSEDDKILRSACNVAIKELDLKAPQRSQNSS